MPTGHQTAVTSATLEQDGARPRYEDRLAAIARTTSAVRPGEDITPAVDELHARGVVFERYEGMSFDEKDIHRGDVHPVAPVAWFRDPSGNILSVVQKAMDPAG